METLTGAAGWLASLEPQTWAIILAVLGTVATWFGRVGLRVLGWGWGLITGAVVGTARAITPKPSEALQAVLDAIHDNRTKYADGRLVHPRLLCELPSKKNDWLGMFWVVWPDGKIQKVEQLTPSELGRATRAAERRRDELLEEDRLLSRMVLVDHLKDGA